MPYENEFAKTAPIVNFFKDKSLKELMNKIQLSAKKKKYKDLDKGYVISQDEIKEPMKIKKILVIDGSKYEYNEKNMNIGLITVNPCLIDIEKMEDYLKEKYPLPYLYRELKKESPYNYLIPLEGIEEIEGKDEKELLRFFIYKMFESTGADNVESLLNLKLRKKESLLETYNHLLKNMVKINIGDTQPCEKCKKNHKYINLESFLNDGNIINKRNCFCETNPLDLYSTDLLQIDEMLDFGASKEALLTQLMLILEKLIMVNIIRNLKINHYESCIQEIAFVLDGTLAIYGGASWLSNAIGEEIYNYKHDNDLLFFSIEKTGKFVQYFKNAESYKNNIKESLKNGMIYFLNDEDIRDEITQYKNERFYGERTYFGKKFFYKSYKNNLYVLNIVFENEMDKYVNINNRNDLENIKKTYGFLDIVRLIERFSSQMYDNGLSFISIANESSSLSNSEIGKKMLNYFVEEVLNKNK